MALNETPMDTDTINVTNNANQTKGFPTMQKKPSTANVSNVNLNNINKMKGNKIMPANNSPVNCSVNLTIANNALKFYLTPQQEQLFTQTLKKIRKRLEKKAYEKCEKLLSSNELLISNKKAILQDLLQVGMIAVCEAIKNYTPGHVGKNGGTASLTTYALNMAEYEMWKNRWEQVGLTVHEGRTATAITKAKENLIARGIEKKDLTVEMIAREAKMTPATIRKYSQIILMVDFNACGTVNEDDPTEFSMHFEGEIYNNAINACIGQDVMSENTTDFSGNPFAILSARDTLACALSALDNSEKFAVYHYYGILGCTKMTQREIGKVLGIKDNSVSCKLEKAMGKMRKALKDMSHID